MLLKPLKSTIVIVFFVLLNATVWWSAWNHRGGSDWGKDSDAILGNVPSEMNELEYFHLKEGDPLLSLSADSMQSLGEELVSFNRPRGTYSADVKKSALKYIAERAEYAKPRDQLKLLGNVIIEQEGSEYRGESLTYYAKKDQLYGRGGVAIKHLVPKSGQVIDMKANSLKARPKREWMELTGDVSGVVTPKFKHQAPMILKSQKLELLGPENQIRLFEEVFLHRGGMKVTARNGDIFLEQMNKKLKYFILNDDVKVTESLLDANGRPIERKAYAERLEGFGQDKLVLSGAPRVVQGRDTIKGYRITMREKMEFIEVEDAMSDVQVEKSEEKKAKER